MPPQKLPHSLRTRFHDGLLLLVLMSSAPLLSLLFNVVAPLLPAIAQDFGGGERGVLAAQFVMSVSALGIIVGGLVGGWFIEYADAKSVLLCGLCLYALAGVACMFAVASGLLLGLRFLQGVAAAVIGAAAMVIIGQRYHGAMRERILGYQNAMGAALGMVGALASGAVAESLGWRASLLLYGLGVLLMLAGMHCLPTSPGAPRADIDRGALRPLWPLYLVIGLVYALLFSSVVQMPFLLQLNGVDSPIVQSRVLAGSGFTTVVAALVYGWLRGRLGGAAIFALCLALMGGGLLLAGLSRSVWPVAIAAAMIGLGSGAVGPYLAGVLLGRAAPAARGRAAGLMYAAMFTGDFANPLVMAPLRAAFGIHASFLALAVATLLAALCVLLRARDPLPR